MADCDPERFLAALATLAAAEQRLSDVVLAEIGAVMGRYPASVLISTDPANATTRPWRRKLFAAPPISPERLTASTWSASMSAASTLRN